MWVNLAGEVVLEGVGLLLVAVWTGVVVGMVGSKSRIGRGRLTSGLGKGDGCYREHGKCVVL